MILFRILFLYSNVLSAIINHNLPACKNCKHFIQYRHISFDQLHRCRRFGKKNIVTGEIKYDFADMCRENNAKCGMNATYFEPVV